MNRAKPAALLFSLMALGEIAIGAVAIVYPPVIALLIGAPVSGPGLLVARMMGVAVLALGITWWMARGEADRLARHRAGFIVYNIGVGVLFGASALAASPAAIPWFVCAVHLFAGAACMALAGMSAHQGSPAQAGRT